MGLAQRVGLAAAACGVLLSGCATTVTRTAPSPAESGLSAGERVTLAVELLNHNHADMARAELQAAIAASPPDTQAIELLRDMDRDPVSALGKENFDYTLRAHETLMTLAGRFLGDPLRFYILARYNGIASPADVTVGEIVKIPVIARRAPAPRISPQAPRATAERRPGPLPPITAKSPAVQPGRATSLRALALEDMNRGRINRAVSLLQQAMQLDPSNPLIMRDLARAQRIQSAVDRK